MTMAILAVIFCLALLIWSADRFVEGAASAARHFGMSPIFYLLATAFG